MSGKLEQLIIAEKPNVAKDIAKFLGASNEGGAFYTPDRKTAIVACFGHLYAQAMPEDYLVGGKPIPAPWFPDKWKIAPKDSDSAKRIRLINSLLNNTKTIINAGDPDREGQLLVDEIIETNGMDPDSPNIKRLWLSATNDHGLRTAFDTLKPNAQFRGYRLAALGRSRGDWLIGMNGSEGLRRATGRRKGVSMGRVQSPVGWLVKERYDQVKNFVSVTYYVPWVRMPDGTIMQWQSSKDMTDGIDEEGRIIKESVAKQILARIEGKMEWECIKAEGSDRSVPPPLPHSLDSLQVKYGKQGISADDVLKTAQSLYEVHKISTYPRTDCRYLPESMLADRPRILKGISHLFPKEFSGANVDIKSRAYNDKKSNPDVAAHHAIIPTGSSPKGQLSPLERTIFAEITRNFAVQMYPDAKYRDFELDVEFSGIDTFHAKSAILIAPGWHEMYGHNADDPEESETQEKELKKTKSLETGGR